jgi:hypothetical protein
MKHILSFFLRFWVLKDITLHIVFFWVVTIRSLVGGNMLPPFSGLKDYVQADIEVIKVRM